MQGWVMQVTKVDAGVHHVLTGHLERRVRTVPLLLVLPERLAEFKEFATARLRKLRRTATDSQVGQKT